MQKLFDNLAINLFAIPRVKSDSCPTTGTLRNFAPRQTGKDTYPPFENTMFGESSFKIFLHFKLVRKTLNGRKMFLKMFFLTNLCVGISKYSTFFSWEQGLFQFRFHRCSKCGQNVFLGGG